MDHTYKTSHNMFTFPFSFFKSAGGGCAYDADVCAFLAATGITDPTIGSALNTLVGSLKADGIWAACDAIYPFVGGTATTNKYNLKDPQDLNAAYRLSFYGNWTFSSDGAYADTNADTDYADTYWIPSAHTNDYHAFRYMNLQRNPACCYDGAGGSPFLLLGVCGQLEYYNGNAANTGIGSVPVGGGWSQLSNRKSSTAVDLWRSIGGSISWSNYGTNTTAVGSVPSNSYLLGSISGGVTGYGSSSRMAFYSVGTQLTDTQAANYWTYVDTFNTALSRAY
jgi:hypothetical protein